VESFGRAVRLNPQLAQAYFGLGNALRSLGMREAAEKALEQAIAIDARIAPAHLMLGMLLGERHQHEKALVCFDRALALAPGLADAHYGRGLVWQSQGEYDRAGRAFTEALAINPDHVHSLHAMANALIVTRQFALAAQMLARAEALHPGFDHVAGMRVFLARQLCDWQAHPADLDGLRERALAGAHVLKPFAALALFDEPELHRKITAAYIRKYHPQAYASDQTLAMRAADKIRIAYVSSDFFNHATSYLLAGLLESHDRAQFEIIALSFGVEKTDAMRVRIRDACDEFIDINQLSDAQVAQFCRGRNIHIAVDLKGLTRDSRPCIFAHRAAPVQVNWLGYPGTMDAPCYDYIIADAVVIPPEQRAHYSEAVIYLPHSYQVNDSHRVISERRQSRTECGLPEKAFVFCCFNNHYKIAPETFACWMRILKQVPDSVLWLLESHEDAHRHLREAAEGQGISGERLIFAPHVDLPEHLARHRLAQLSLDTLPYNAHTTASDALWAGLPHLTCLGQAFAGRVAASLLHAIGMPEMVAQDLAHYEKMAIDMARQPELLDYAHWKLSDLLRGSGLFDTRLFARHIESAYSRIYQQHLFGRLPQDIRLDRESSMI
jgi:protein O-GlcNAc transferase